MNPYFEAIRLWYKRKQLEYWKRKTDEASEMLGGTRVYLFRDKNGKYMITTREGHKKAALKAGMNKFGIDDLLVKNALYYSKPVKTKPYR